MFVSTMQHPNCNHHDVYFFDSDVQRWIFGNTRTRNIMWKQAYRVVMEWNAGAIVSSALWQNIIFCAEPKTRVTDVR